MPKKVNVMRLSASHLAVIIAFIALLYTISSDRRFRECDFLYRKHEKLLELVKNSNQVRNALIDIDRRLNIAASTGDNNTMEETSGEYRLRLGGAVRHIIELTELHRYVFSDEEFKSIKSMSQQIQEKFVDDQRRFTVPATLDAHCLLSKFLDYTKCAYVRYIEMVNTQLEKACDSQPKAPNS